MREIVCRTSGLGKRFRIYARPGDRLLEWLLGGTRHRDRWVLRDVGFSIAAGEAVGLIGRNGAGKTTLLRVIAGALAKTEGEVFRSPNVVAISPFGLSLSAHLSGRENVAALGRALYLPDLGSREAQDEVAAFAELGEAFDEPTRRYSEGMKARLAFATFTQSAPALLLIDEALTAGDEAFTEKCVQRLIELRERGTALLLATHNPFICYRICSRVLVLDAGRLVCDTEPHSALATYRDLWTAALRGSSASNESPAY